MSRLNTVIVLVLFVLCFVTTTRAQTPNPQSKFAPAILVDPNAFSFVSATWSSPRVGKDLAVAPSPSPSPPTNTGEIERLREERDHHAGISGPIMLSSFGAGVLSTGLLVAWLGALAEPHGEKSALPGLVIAGVGAGMIVGGTAWFFVRLHQRAPYNQKIKKLQLESKYSDVAMGFTPLCSTNFCGVNLTMAY